jgi:hypothetical protein
MLRHGALALGLLACSSVYAAAEEAPAPDPAAERAKIEFLLKTVAESPVTFVRNGSEYDGKKAAEHLRAKWKGAGGEVQTARQFIELCATKSSLSGKAYEIILADRKTRVPCAAWLEALLTAHEAPKSGQKADAPAPASEK